MSQECYIKIQEMIQVGAIAQADHIFKTMDISEKESCENILSLSADLKKARVMRERGTKRQGLAIETAKAYERVFIKTGGYYSGINTATMYSIVGNKDKASAIARDVIEKIKTASRVPGVYAYNSLAAQAQAHLIIGDADSAENALRDAIELDPHNYGNHAKTLREFEIIQSILGETTEWLMPLRPPSVLHLSGFSFTLNDDSTVNREALNQLNYLVTDFLQSQNIGMAFGSLAAGSDIVIAEILMAMDIEFHAVLPCPTELFDSMSLTPFGNEWRHRYDACLGQATSIRYVSSDRTVLDPLTQILASEIAMGLATLQADHYATKAIQLLVSNTNNKHIDSIKKYDEALWSKSGYEQCVIPLDISAAPVAISNIGTKHSGTRSLKAMLFMDVKDYSTLSERQVSTFIEQVFTELSIVTQAYEEQISYINTWGDGIFIALDSVKSAALLALEIQQTFNDIDMTAAGYPEGIGMRIGAHYGPVHSVNDPFMNRQGLFGREVSFAARIEPVTVSGSIYVSEAFACALAVVSQGNFRTEYISNLHISERETTVRLFALTKKDYC